MKPKAAIAAATQLTVFAAYQCWPAAGPGPTNSSPANASTTTDVAVDDEALPDPSAEFDAGIDLMHHAATRGLIRAKEYYGYSEGAVIATADGYEFDADRIAAYKKNSLGHLHDAAASGSTVAWARLSEIHEQGNLVPASPDLAARLARNDRG